MQWFGRSACFLYLWLLLARLFFVGTCALWRAARKSKWKDFGKSKLEGKVSKSIPKAFCFCVKIDPAQSWYISNARNKWISGVGCWKTKGAPPPQKKMNTSPKKGPFQEISSSNHQFSGYVFGGVSIKNPSNVCCMPTLPHDSYPLLNIALENHHFLVGDRWTQMADFPAGYVSLSDHKSVKRLVSQPPIFLSHEKSESFSCCDFFFKPPPPPHKKRQVNKWAS